MAEKPSLSHTPSAVQPAAPKPKAIEIPEYVCAARVEPEEVQWLWYPYIPAAKVTMLEGDPGVGKSWICCALASAITRGEPFPGQLNPCPPGNVLILNSEDGLADTIVPRLIKMGANLKRVFMPKSYMLLDSDGLAGLEALMKEVRCAMMFIDPLHHYMGRSVDINKANEVRGFMAPIADLAFRTQAAIVTIRHLRKNRDGGKMTAGMGSMDFGAAVRSMLQVEQTRSGDLVMEHIKCNVAAKGPPLSYTFSNEGFAWQGVYVYKKSKAPGQEGKASKAAREWLQQRLAKGPAKGTDILEEAIQAGHSAGTIQRARAGLIAVEKRKDGWWWSLKEAAGGSEAPTAPPPEPKIIPIPPSPVQNSTRHIEGPPVDDVESIVQRIKSQKGAANGGE